MQILKLIITWIIINGIITVHRQFSVIISLCLFIFVWEACWRILSWTDIFDWLVGLLVIQLSYGLWRYCIKAFWWIVILYSMFVLVSIYVFQFEDILSRFQNSTGMSDNMYVNFFWIHHDFCYILDRLKRGCLWDAVSMTLSQVMHCWVLSTAATVVHLDSRRKLEVTSGIQWSDVLVGPYSGWGVKLKELLADCSLTWAQLGSYCALFHSSKNSCRSR